MAEVEFAPRAQADLVRLKLWFAELDDEVAARAVTAILAGIDRLAVSPFIAPQLPNSNSRELQIRFGRYGYVARYGVRGDRVIVARIFHGREKR